jgi:adenylate kinase family enzyme
MESSMIRHVALDMERVLVIGCGGSGKTTVAHRLADSLRLPLIHLDAHFWRPGWVPTSADEWQRVVAQLVAQPRWVMDGNYGGTLEMRLASCDSVVFMDLPRRVCLWRILKRRLRYRGRTRPDVAPGCPERLTWEFVKWVWTYPKRRRAGILERLSKLTGPRVIILSSQRHLDRFLANLDAPPG